MGIKISELPAASALNGTELSPLVQGGTTKQTPFTAIRTFLAGFFASKGANSDITSLSGLTTPLSIIQGGTGATTDTGARTNLSAAKSGVNTDITSLASPAIASATATTQTLGDNSTKVATTAYIDQYTRSKMFPVDASVGSNALTVFLDPCSIDFHSTTQNDGTPVTRTVVSQLSMVVSSGSTLGTTNAVQSDIAVLAIDNAGTVELAVVNLAGGVSLSESGLISTTAEGGAGGADSATTIYSTTARTNVAYRVVGFVRSTQTTAGTWATAPSLVQSLGGLPRALSPSRVRVHTANGYGSTNTAIRRFTTILENFGSDITYADSATLGGSFTINTPGVYCITYQANPGGMNLVSGISVNSTQLTAAISSVSIANRLAIGQSYAANALIFSTWTSYFQAGDILRAHDDTGGAGMAANYQFNIVRVA